MHSQSNSDASSFPLSLPDDNRRPVYFVQSPSRHSQQEYKIGGSYESMPALSSLMASPQPYHGINHSRQSSSSRISDVLKDGSKKTTLHGVGYGVPRNLEEFDTLDEGEGLLGEDEESREGKSVGCYILMFIAGFIALFSLFALILLGVSKHQKPQINVRSIYFNRFGVQAGTDDTGVLTDMVTVNATVTFALRNTGTFFGVHVSSTPLALSYSQLNVGSGRVEGFWQRRHSTRNISVVVIGDKIPLYGNGAPLVTPKGLVTVGIPLQLSFMVRSRALVLGELVKTTFIRKINCSIDFSRWKLNVAIPLTNSCTYEW